MPRFVMAGARVFGFGPENEVVFVTSRFNATQREAWESVTHLYLDEPASH